jgi:hypothetical protein
MQQARPSLPRRLARFLWRWSWRALVLVALGNLAWDLGEWHRRESATGDLRFFREAERPDDIDYGLAELRIINETGRTFLVDSLLLDGWGGPFTHLPESERRLGPQGEPDAVRDEATYVDRLLSAGRLDLVDVETRERRTLRFVVDRRRPTSCEVELRIAEAGETVSGCRLLRRRRTAFRWLFGLSVVECFETLSATI